MPEVVERQTDNVIERRLRQTRRRGYFDESRGGIGKSKSGSVARMVMRSLHRGLEATPSPCRRRGNKLAGGMILQVTLGWVEGAEPLCRS
jgi:hypothetical protein